MSQSPFEYWKHAQLVIAVVEGSGGMFPLENGEGLRFVVRSQLSSDAGYAQLQAGGRV